jgi:hypothetical protein
MKSQKYIVTLIVSWLILFAANLSAQDNIERYDGLKSESKAFHLSLWSTAVPVISSGMWFLLSDNLGNFNEVIGPVSLGIGGILIGPSIGYFYSNKAGRGLSGIGNRTGLGASTALLSILIGTCSLDSVEPNAVLIACGGGIFLYSAVADIIKVKKAAREYNQTINQRNSLTITPEYFPKYSAVGLSIRIPL